MFSGRSQAGPIQVGDQFLGFIDWAYAGSSISTITKIKTLKNKLPRYNFFRINLLTIFAPPFSN
jgi:hypothetical protein